jgi:Alpha/beta hydrolase family
VRVKRLLSFIGIVALIALGFGLGLFYMLLPHTPVVLNQDAVVKGADPQTRVQLKNDAGSYIDIEPSTPATTLFIFYPGGLVRPQAYEWLGIALAPLGVRTVIPVFSADLAVNAPNRANELLAKLGTYSRVVIGGHSLGGAMAARYTLKNPDKVNGLVLMGAFSANSDDLSTLTIPVLSLAAEHDGLATLDEVKTSLARLPKDTKLELIEGAVHSFFGRYGPQRGDSIPTVTRDQAEQDIVSALSEFFQQY